MKLAVALVPLLLLCAACRGGNVDPFELAHQRVTQSVSEGSEVSSDVGAVPFSVRYNPARCACPDYEIFAYEQWMRAFIDGETPSMQALRTADPLAVGAVTGKIEPKRRRAENGVLYPVVVAR